MSAVRDRDSIAELAIRRRLWANGFRYRLRAKVIGKPDLIFRRQRIAVFVDGDLWHGNSWRVRGLPSFEAQFPTNTAWWVAKIRRTMERDAAVNQALSEQEWTVLRFWESDVLAEPDRVAHAIANAVKPDRPYAPLPLSQLERKRRGSVGARAAR